MSKRPAAWSTRQIPSQRGRVVAITGANSGIGWHAALELARTGAEVILAARSAAKAEDAAARIRHEVADATLRAETVDLADLGSVRALGGRLGELPRLDLLINNAGVMNVPTRQLTKDGFELQFGTNFLGPFALTALVMPALLRAQAPRVTTVSSGAANMGTKQIRFDDLSWEHGYGPWKAYCQSKLADLLFAQELMRRAAAAGLPLVSNAAHPGFARTNLQSTGPGRPPNWIERLMAAVLSQDAAHGALPTLRAAAAPDAGPGSYFGPARMFQLKGDPVAVEIPRPARDEATAARLWSVAEQLTGVTFAL
jgi:NAD(P)-dependent dehydrogenase (short-subunit alcohol dehydrogenase family)